LGQKKIWQKKKERGRTTRSEKGEARRTRRKQRVSYSGIGSEVKLEGSRGLLARSNRGEEEVEDTADGDGLELRELGDEFVLGFLFFEFFQVHRDGDIVAVHRRSHHGTEVLFNSSLGSVVSNRRVARHRHRNLRERGKTKGEKDERTRAQSKKGRRHIQSWC
jgi:hypothetical protein